MPERRVVDTSVVSLFLKAATPPDAAAYRPHLAGRDLTISFMTLAELHGWATAHRWGAATLGAMTRYIGHTYTVRHSDAALCRRWAAVWAGERAAGRTLSTADAWIAATALELGVPLVSHNRRHFQHVPGLALISEAPL